MDLSRYNRILLLMLIMIILCTPACGIKYTIKGRVIDAESKAPIEGAAVAIEWKEYDLLPRMTGLSSGYRYIATYEALSDADGFFEITKIVGKYSDMSVYKKGYICWNDERFFDPRGKDIDDMFKRKEKVSVNNGMTIELEPLQDVYPIVEHARFVSDANLRCEGKEIFYNAIKNEVNADAVRKFYQKQREDAEGVNKSYQKQRIKGK